jgi:hypothetical protein
MTVAGVSGSGSREPCQHDRRPNNSLQPTPRGDILTRGAAEAGRWADSDRSKKEVEPTCHRA